jgi:hypothetical protein
VSVCSGQVIDKVTKVTYIVYTLPNVTKAKSIHILSFLRLYVFSTFADDTTIYIERTPENLRNAVKYLKEFAIISGLQCIIDKTSVIPIGSVLDITDNNILCPDIELTWETEFTILGLTIDNKLAKLYRSFAKCNDKVKALITKWRLYNLSVNGLITIAKSILLPQYTYIGMFWTKCQKTTIKVSKKHWITLLYTPPIWSPIKQVNNGLKVTSFMLTKIRVAMVKLGSQTFSNQSSVAG